MAHWRAGAPKTNKLGIKIVYLLDGSDLFKICNLVYDGCEIVRSLYSSLQGQTFYGGYSEFGGLDVAC